MSDGYTCPKEGCDYGDAEDENKSLAAVRSHINSAGDHDWHALRADLYAAAEAEDVPDSYDTEEGDQSEDDEDDDTESDDDQSDGDSEEMATEEEYQEQHDDDGESGNETTESDEQDTPDDGGESGFSVPAFSTTTWLFIGGLLLVAFIAYKMFGGDAAADYEPPEEQADTDEQDDGAMVPDVVEDGTGGVQT